MNAFYYLLRKSHLNLCPRSNCCQLPSMSEQVYQFVLCRFLDSAEHITNSQSWHLAYDKNRYANNEASWYSLHFVLYRIHEGSCSCTRLETNEPLRHSTCLLRLYSFCPKFKIRGKVYIFINVHKTA